VEYMTQDGMKPLPTKPDKSRRAWAVSRKHFALNGTLADRVISLAHILGRPVRNAAGTRIGRVSDIVVRWDAGNEHPPVTGVFVKVRGALAVVQHTDVTLSQTEIRLRSDARMEWRPVWGDDDVALARDVLDRQLVDTSGLQVVRAADAYLLNGPQGWELAGIDVGLLSFGRRLVTRRRACPPPDRVIDWAQLLAFVPRLTDTTTAWQSGPTDAAGITGSGLQLGRSVAQLRELRGPEVAALLSDLSRHQQAQLFAMAHPSAAVEALRQLDSDHREALLAELDEADRARLRAMLRSYAR
jgi:sporulation protein YlmC with PRC-barrel domain